MHELLQFILSMTLHTMMSSNLLFSDWPQLAWVTPCFCDNQHKQSSSKVWVGAPFSFRTAGRETGLAHLVVLLAAGRRRPDVGVSVMTVVLVVEVALAPWRRHGGGRLTQGVAAVLCLVWEWLMEKRIGR